MDRLETYIGQSIYEWDLSKPDQNKMVALAKIAAALFGTNTIANGLVCAATAPASMVVNLGAGEIYQIESLEATTCGTLPADTTHQIMKQGIALDQVAVPNANTGVTAFTPPGTSGQSINYLIEASYADQDVSIDPTTGAAPIVLTFFNASNPTQPFQGPNNSGSTSNTFRKGVVSLQVKAGVAATTGTQTTPVPDSGFVGLWVISVPFGATTLTSANIAQYVNAPILPSSILQSIQTDNLNYGVDVSATPGVVQATYPLPVTALTENMNLWVRFKNANPSTMTFTPNPGVIAPSPVVGGAHAALQGGEAVANGRGNLVWRADITSWVLMESSGGSVQIAPATQSQHAMQLGQFSATAIADGLIKSVKIQVFQASGTYTPSTGMTFCIVEQVGGGGGGGGSVGGSGTSAAAGGGGAGAYSRTVFSAASIGASQVFTIGAAGTGATAGNNGGTGGSTIFGPITANGGMGGNGAPANSATGSLNGGGTGGTVAGANVNVIGQSGLSGIGFAPVSALSGGGGSGPFGSGPPGSIVAAGQAAPGRGSGGSGAASLTASFAGGSGSPGLILVTEYCTQ